MAPAPHSDRTAPRRAFVPANCKNRKHSCRIITVMQYDAVMRSPSTSATDRPKASGTRITITLPPEHYEHVVWMAQKKRVSASWIVRDAVAKYLAEDMPLFAERGRDSQ
jgi:ribbon-helix-helix CopG family protein